METISLILLVFVLGLRHGLDADHLACIDGLTRYNIRMNSPIARWVGTLFSFGHGLVVTCIAVILGIFMKNFKIPDLVNTVVTWISIVSLFSIGTLNIYNLLRTKSTTAESFQLSGIKGKFLPRIVQETTNPFFCRFNWGHIRTRCGYRQSNLDVGNCSRKFSKLFPIHYGDDLYVGDDDYRYD